VRAGSDEGGDHRQRLRARDHVREGTALVAVPPRPAGEQHVVHVHPDRHAELLPRALGEADVVEVPVREDDRLHVVGPAP
jgi:hypothetical protein